MEINKKYGMLTIIKEGETLRLPSGQTNKTYLCRCDCGREKQIRKAHLVNYKTYSCGCRKRKTFGESKTPLYNKWRAMRDRGSENTYRDACYQRKNIKMCDEWLNDFSAFKKFALANGYRNGLTTDRIDSNKGYTPDNVRFVTPKENTNNRDVTIFVEYQGKKIAFTEAYEKSGTKINISTIRYRIKHSKLSFEQALLKPVATNYSARIKKESN
jgi:hypothetical protein